MWTAPEIWSQSDLADRYIRIWFFLDYEMKQFAVEAVASTDRLAQSLQSHATRSSFESSCWSCYKTQLDQFGFQTLEALIDREALTGRREYYANIYLSITWVLLVEFYAWYNRILWVDSIDAAWTLCGQHCLLWVVRAQLERPVTAPCSMRNYRSIRDVYAERSLYTVNFTAKISSQAVTCKLMICSATLPSPTANHLVIWPACWPRA